MRMEEKLISPKQTKRFRYLPEWSIARRNLGRESPARTLDIAKPYLFSPGPARDPAFAVCDNGLIFLFHQPGRQVFAGVFHRSFRDQSHVMEIVSGRDLLSATCLRSAKRIRSAGPLVIDHRVTVPLPNFKYARTSQLVTANYLGRLLTLEEAI